MSKIKERLDDIEDQLHDVVFWDEVDEIINQAKVNSSVDKQVYEARFKKVFDGLNELEKSSYSLSDKIYTMSRYVALHEDALDRVDVAIAREKRAQLMLASILIIQLYIILEFFLWQ